MSECHPEPVTTVTIMALPHPIAMSPMNDTTNQPASDIDIDLLTYDGVL